MEMRRERTEDWQEWSRIIVCHEGRGEDDRDGLDGLARTFLECHHRIVYERNNRHGRYLLGTSAVSQAAAVVETDPIRDRHVRSDDGRCRQRPPNPDGRIFASTIFLLFTITRRPKHHHNR
jgi:hypothetical protein